MEWLNSYHWPGNIRELRNAIERAVIVSDGAMINTKHLSLDSRGRSPTDSLVPPIIPEEGVDFNEIIDRVSSELIPKALAQTGGNRSGRPGSFYPPPGAALPDEKAGPGSIGVAATAE